MSNHPGLLPTYDDVNDNFRIGKGNARQESFRPRSPRFSENRQRTPPPPCAAVSRALLSHRSSLSTSSIASSIAEQYSDKDTLLPKMHDRNYSDEEGLRLPSQRSGLFGHALSHYHYVKRKSGRWLILIVVTGFFIVALVQYSPQSHVSRIAAGIPSERYQPIATPEDDNDERSQWAKLAVPGRGAGRAKQEQRPETPVKEPLTNLGAEADSVYENMGSTDINEFRRDLESFLDLAFPAKDSDLSDPDSLLNIVYDYMPPPTSGELVARYRQRTAADRNKEAEEASPQSAFQRMMLLPLRSLSDNVRSLRNGLSKLSERDPERQVQHTIQRNIFQTSWQEGPNPPDEQGVSTWRDMNGGDNYKYQYFDDAAAHDWISSRFNMSGDPPLRAGRTPGRGGIADTHARMAGIPVMQSDFWRYAILASEGGVYSDLDTGCLRPIVTWHRDPWARWTPKLPAGTEVIDGSEPIEPTPALIVGIEQDVNDRPDWHQWYPRPVGIVQWTIASSRGHPVMLDVLRRVSHSVNPVADINDDDEPEAQESASRKLEAVVEKTGPGPFTDSVLRYLGAKYNATWPDLRNLPQEGRMFGDNDVLVLSVTAFSPGVGQFGAGDTTHDAALVWHQFSGSWKKEHGARR